jgi:DNA (cytosine-5)-methyltransferase 1
LDSDRVVERMKLIPAGSNYSFIPDGHPLAVRGLISHVYRRLDPDAPAYTIIANGGGGTHGYHHREPRRLSNREKARLQSFPDDFEFAGGQKGAYADVRRQIGNAVPPAGAQIIVQTLVDTLRAAHIGGTTGHAIREARRQTAAERPQAGQQASALHRVSQ